MGPLSLLYLIVNNVTSLIKTDCPLPKVHSSELGRSPDALVETVSQNTNACVGQQMPDADGHARRSGERCTVVGAERIEVRPKAEQLHHIFLRRIHRGQRRSSDLLKEPHQTLFRTDP